MTLTLRRLPLVLPTSEPNTPCITAVGLTSHLRGLEDSYRATVGVNSTQWHVGSILTILAQYIHYLLYLLCQGTFHQVYPIGHLYNYPFMRFADLADSRMQSEMNFF